MKPTDNIEIIFPIPLRNEKKENIDALSFLTILLIICCDNTSWRLIKKL
jgi:hypothetical protein